MIDKAIIIKGGVSMLKTVLFDFGGVIAEEGFRDGLNKIAEINGLDQAGFYAIAEELIYSTGYLTGGTEEAFYWKALRERTGVRGSDQQLRSEIMKRFTVRPAMLDCIDLLKAKGHSVVMLSDQTNWLEELDESIGLFRHFDRILNSFRISRSKRDADTFRYVCDLLGERPENVLFVDDNDGHIQRASATGMKTIHFTTFNDFQKNIRLLTGIETLCSPAKTEQEETIIKGRA